MVSLSDDELRLVMRLAEPIRPDRRGAYLQDIADALAACPERGFGLLHRIAAEAQARHCDYPTFRQERPAKQFAKLG